MEQRQFESLYPADSWAEPIRKILAVVEKGQSAQLLGLPGVGRYLVLGLLAYNKSVRIKHLGEKHKLYQFVYIDFSEIRNRPLSDVMKMLFLALADSLRDRGMAQEYEMVQKLLRNAIALNDELVLTEELKHAVEQLGAQDIKTIFLFDRVEDYIPHVESTFFANLRILRNRAKYHFSVVFALNKPLEELLEQHILADFYDLMVDNAIYLSLYDKSSVDFRLSHLEEITGKHLPEKITTELLRITGGHGKLMRMASESYLAADTKPQELEKFLLTQNIVVNALCEVWLSFSPSEQQVLLHSGKGGDEKTLQYLAKIGILDKEGNVTMPLLKAYVSQEHIVKTSRQATIVYDEESKRIRKGDIVLSDDLTSSEFLMLVHLLDHAGEIVGRDDLVNAVWGKSVSTAGVTEQALDQMLYRLRRKIEDDPNQPEHIHTVKGRGVKFVP